MRKRMTITVLAIAITLLTLLSGSPTAGASPPGSPPPKTTTTTTPKAAPTAAEIKRQHEINVYLWYAEINRQAEYARLVAFAAAVHRAELERRSLHGYPAPYLTRDGFLMGSGRCGGNLPPCWRLKTESGGLINVYYGRCHRQCHPRNTAQGKWAFTNPTWKRHRGYATAALAPEWVQDERAAEVWAGGRGCSNWSAC